MHRMRSQLLNRAGRLRLLRPKAWIDDFLCVPKSHRSRPKREDGCGSLDVNSSLTPKHATSCQSRPSSFAVSLGSGFAKRCRRRSHYHRPAIGFSMGRERLRAALPILRSREGCPGYGPDPISRRRGERKLQPEAGDRAGGIDLPPRIRPNRGRVRWRNSDPVVQCAH